MSAPGLTNVKYQSFLVIEAPEAEHDQILHFYRSHQVLERSQKVGALRGKVLRAPSANELLVTSLWRDEQGYDAWVASDDRAEILRGLKDNNLSQHSRGWSVASTGSGDPDDELDEGIRAAFPSQDFEVLLVV